MAISIANFTLSRLEAFDEFFECFTLYKLHRVEVIVAGPSEAEDRGNVCVTNAYRCAGLTQQAKPRRFVTNIFFADDFKRHQAELDSVSS